MYYQMMPTNKDKYQQPGRESVQAIADISHLGYVVIATKTIHRLKIRPIVHS